MNRLRELSKLGQSPWYDNIARSLLVSGGLRNMIRRDGIAGVTTNPSIFEKAISGSNDYDAEIRRLARQGMDAVKIYDELTLQDVAQAADILKGVYARTKHLDGYVSIEVSPHLAHDAVATIAEAERLFNQLDRDNVMIKVPATVEGIQAIRILIARGVNVNATLIFSQEHYQQVAWAYQEGIKERAARGGSVDRIASVASFFVSRIDTSVDKMLDARGGLGELKGGAAVAQSKVIYEIYQQTFSSLEWKRLARKGARVQRLLFGSTGTKNPAYSDVKYVEGLIGRGTVNTLPEVTVVAFRDHGIAKATLGRGIEAAKGHLARLKALGIDVEEVGRQLQVEGVQAFIDSYDKLLASLQNKRKQFEK